MAYSNAEKQARWRQRQKQLNDGISEELAKAQALNAKLQEKVGKLKDRVANLEHKLTGLKIKRMITDALIEEWKIRQHHNGTIPPETYRTIAKALHPDRDPSASEREHACKLFNDFCDQGKARILKKRAAATA